MKIAQDIHLRKEEEESSKRFPRVQDLSLPVSLPLFPKFSKVWFGDNICPTQKQIAN